MTHDVCPECGHAFSRAASPGGMCPRCLLFGGAEPPPDDFLLEDLRDAVPGFRVEAMLGRGGMGAVFRARQLDLERDVAIKFIAEREDDPAFGERFEREAQTMARLNHANIVAVHSYGRAGGFAYIIMEYIAGGDLAQLIAAGRIPEAVALGVVEQVCSALAYAHEQGCVHRDIKPGNILLDAKGRVKVADFGLVKVLGESAATSALTVTGFGVGTPLYAAPEQTKPGAPVDHRADIYALGVLLYEMLTGEVPRGIFQSPSAKSGTLVRWDGIIVRAMDAQPERRYASTGDISRELVVIRRELAPGFVPWRRRRKKWALAGAGVAAVAALAFALLRPADFTIARTAREIVLTDARGSEGTLVISQPAPGRVQFSAAGRTFRAGFGFRATGGIALAGSERIVVHAKDAAVRFEGDFALPPGASLEVEAASISIPEGAHILSSGAGHIALSASGGILVGKGAIIETGNGGLTLTANATGTTAGPFIGIEISGATLTTRGAGKVALTGRGGLGSEAARLHGIHLRSGAVVRSTLGGPGAGTITLTGMGGSGGDTRGVLITGGATMVTSITGAITIAGTAGTGEGDNMSGIDLRDGGQVVSTGTGPGAAAITLLGTGGDHSVASYNCGVIVSCTDSNYTFGAGISTIDGPISLTGTGGSGESMLIGVFIGDGTSVTASGTGRITLTGTGGNGLHPASAGVHIFGAHANGHASRVTVADGDLTITGTAQHRGSADVFLEEPAFVGTTGKGRIALLGDSMKLTGTVQARESEVFIRPRTAGVRINLGSILGPTAGTLELSQDEMEKITAGTLHIGDGESGAVITSMPLSPTGSLDIATGGSIRIDTPITLPPGGFCTIRADSLDVTMPGAGLVASGAGGITLDVARGISLWEKTHVSTGKGALVLRTDRLGLDPQSFISSGTGPLRIAPHTAGTRIRLGGASAPGDPPTLGLSDADLGRIAGGVVQWGDESSGPIVVTEPIAPENRSKLPPGIVEKK